MVVMGLVAPRGMPVAPRPLSIGILRGTASRAPRAPKSTHITVKVYSLGTNAHGLIFFLIAR